MDYCIIKQQNKIQETFINEETFRKVVQNHASFNKVMKINDKHSTNCLLMWL